jgi:hypothetical protein
MKPKWTREEELNFLTGVKEGKSFDELGKIHERSPSGLHLRLKKIVYENIKNGKKVSGMAKMLNTPVDKVKQYYYDYKKFSERKVLQNGGSLSESKVKSDNIQPKKHVDDKLKRIEKENILMKEVLENLELKRKLNRLVKDGKLDKKVISNIKNLSKK